MTPAGRGLAVTALAGALAGLPLGCAWSHTRTLAVGAPARPAGMPATCADGGAPVVLADPACGAGCGWSCLPGR